MNHVVIEDGCHIQGSVVCNNVQLQERAVLKDCQVLSSVLSVGKKSFKNAWTTENASNIFHYTIRVHSHLDQQEGVFGCHVVVISNGVQLLNSHLLKWKRILNYMKLLFSNSSHHKIMYCIIVYLSDWSWLYCDCWQRAQSRIPSKKVELSFDSFVGP